MKINLAKLIHTWSGSAYDSEDFKMKNQFHIAGRNRMRELANTLGYTKGEYEVRSCKGGMAVSGEVILHTEDVYVCVGHNFAYFRSCAGRKDYTGGPNIEFDPALLEHPFFLAELISKSYFVTR